MEIKNKLTLRGLFNCFASGAKNTLAVGAAAICVGIIVGVVTLTGVGFRLGFVVLQTAGDIGAFFGNIWPISYFTRFFNIRSWCLWYNFNVRTLSTITQRHSTFKNQ